MILKIIGSIFILSSTVFLGLYYGNIESYRVSDLLEIKRAFSILKSEIEFAKTPLLESLANISKRTSSPINKIFINLRLKLMQHKDETIVSMWESSLLDASKEAYFTKEDLEQLKSFGKCLSYLDASMQLLNVNLVVGYIDQCVVTLNKTRGKNKKMFNSLGVLGGILIVIVFL